MASATYEKSSGLSLKPAVKTIGELTTDDICTYVTIQNVEVTDVYDNDGAYSTPNITVKDSNGNTIQLYKAVVDKDSEGAWSVKVGDTITITAAVGVFKETLQLRNTSASEIKAAGASTGPIYGGEQVVIYAPAYNKALSGSYNGFYNNGTDVTMTDGTLSGFSASDVWTVIDNGDGTWSFSYDGQNIAMDDSFSSMPLGGKNDKWVLEDAGNGLWYIKNTVRNAYMEWYDSKNYWSAYNRIDSGSEGMFALAFYKVTDLPEPPSVEVEFPESFVIYNDGAQGVLAGQDDNQTSPSVNSAAATVTDGVATPTNGARVFTVEKTEDGYYRFKAADGYLASNGTGSNAFYSAQASEEADWTVTAYNGGWNLKSRTAKYNSNAQYLEYYSGSYKTYSLYNDSDKDIYTFHFYPVAEGVTVTDGIVNAPVVTFGYLPDAYVGQDYAVTFTVDAVFGVNAVSAKYGDTVATLTEEDGAWSFTIPGDALTEGGQMVLTVSGTDTKNVTFSSSTKITVKDEPVITGVFPAANAQTGGEKRPEIGFTFGNAGEEPTIALTVNGTAVTPVVADGKATYTPAQAMADGKVTVTATITRNDQVSATKTWSFTIGTAQYQLYFGQLHSHTAEYSDGAGTLQEGLDHVAELSERDNVDFVAFTDHSNYFDTSSEANPEAALYDVSQMTEESKAKWDTYKGKVAEFNAEHAGEIVVLAGFEMTWSGGPGHINTFNTLGIVSRNNKTLNNKTADAGMKAYYALLSNENLVDSISQFNHPGTTFGNFSDFAYYDPIIDTRMYLVEVGNGEGAIGSNGYFPSYEQYIMALDKGWHLAPTNNQDNHKGSWGNANDARDVILTDDFSEEGIYEAIRNYRVYATEDKNLEINYTLNGEMLGSIIKEAETAEIEVSVYDPDSSDSISKVEVVVNSGKVAYTWDDPTELAAGELKCTIPADYNYYFIRVTQGDGDIAVTAPVWIGEVVKLGVSSLECGTAIPVTDEELTLTTTLFNSETSEATVKSITYTSGSETLGTDNTGYTIPASGTLAVDWKYTPKTAKVMSVTATAVIVQDGIEYAYSKSVTLDILDASQLVYIGIDASHYNEYVAGNYKDSMGNFSNLAAGYAVRTVELKTSGELIAACENANGKYKAIILTAPSRRLAEAQSDPRTYSAAELEAIVNFNAAGGMVILAGWSDNYENYDVIQNDSTILHMAATQNAVLEALGSSLRIGDDATYDDDYSKIDGVDPWRLYFNTYNWDSFLTQGVEYDAAHSYDNMYTQLYSHYGGATIYAVGADGKPTSTLPDTVSPVVYGHDSTYSKDVDEDGLGGDTIPKYAVAEDDERLMVLATEQLAGKGLIVVSGAAFMSNFEVQAQPESAAEKNYSNYTICENLVTYLNPVTITPIKDVQAQKQEGVKYTVEGVVTSNASGYDKDTAFFDCIYVQDDTAGINAFPVAGNYKIGDVVRITGTTSSYQGERQLNVSSIEKIADGTAPEPKPITTREAAQSTYLGSLVKIQGVVVSFAEAQGLIQTIMVRDETGYDARVFIDGYITQNKVIGNLAVGHEITVVGLSSYDTSFDGPAARIRVRDRADIVCTAEVVDIPPAYTPPSGGGSGNKTESVNNPDGSTTTTVTKPDGSSSATTKYPDGSSVVVNTDKDGSVETTVKVPEQNITASQEEEKNVQVSMPEQKPTDTSAGAPTITVDLAGKENVKVELPVENATAGTVAIRVDKDGNEEILKDTAQTETGIAVTLSDGDTIKIVDNAKTFDDVPDTHWAKNDVDYMSSRELLNGTGEATFSPDMDMTRAMVWTLLARANDVDTATGNSWYEAGQNWVVEEKVSDGTEPDEPITREQLVTMLYRQAGSPASQGDLSAFGDADSVSDWAREAMIWAVSAGIIIGTDTGDLAPQLTATRAQTATIFTRFMSAGF